MDKLRVILRGAFSFPVMLVARAALIVYGGLYFVFTYLLARRVCSRGTPYLYCINIVLQSVWFTGPLP
jgi:hypothetical protein